MSGGAKPTALLPTYDAQELRRRMAVCFTIGELYGLADRLQVPQAPAWSNSPQDASRDIVRHFERSGALAFLVEALREAKPFTEWPDALPAPAPPPAPSPAAIEPGPAATGGATRLEAPSEQALEFADTSLAAPSDRPTRPADLSEAELSRLATGKAPLDDGASGRDEHARSQESRVGFAPARMPRPGEAPGLAPVLATAAAPTISEAAAPPSSIRVLPPTSVRPATVWPGTTAAAPAPARKSLDPRILLAAGAAILVAAVATAFLVGRASSAPAPEAPSPRTDHVPIATLAAEALVDSLERVARACQIEPNSLRGHSLFEVAYHRCGAPPPARAADPRPPSLEPDEPIADPEPPAPTGKKGRKAGPNKLQPVDPGPASPPSTSSGCLSSCGKEHNACKARCGPEPQLGSQYDGYQACLSGCLKAVAHCKLGCH